MQPWVHGLEAGLLQQKRNAELRRRSNRTARSRDFAYVLHSALKLKQSFDLAVSSILAPAAPASSPPGTPPSFARPLAETAVPSWRPK